MLLSGRRGGVIAGHPVLNANSRNMAAALADAQLLAEFHTSLDTTVLARMTAGRLHEAFSRRALPQEVHRLTVQHPGVEIARLVRRALPRLATPHVFAPDVTIHAVDRAMSEAVGAGTTAVYAYEDGAALTFQTARRLGLPTVYDLPIGYWRMADEILQEEAARKPDWASTLAVSRVRNHEARTARKEEELALAQTVIVASSFTARSLRYSPRAPSRVEVIPYGSPSLMPAPKQKPDSDRVIRALYVGGLSQRKGLSYMFDAVGFFRGSVLLTVVGMRNDRCLALDRELERSHVTWVPSLPHDKILDLMASHDVLLFPSLFEGFGLVLLEAMSQGTPIIATPHTAAPDLITDGVEGWIVPIRSSASIAERLQQLLDAPGLSGQMGAAAAKTARGHTWSTYRSRTAALVAEVTT